MFDRNRWLVCEHEEKNVSLLSKELNTSPLCAKLLINRGYAEPNAAKAFMAKSDSFLYNPYLLKDIKPATKRIRRAIEKEEKITIYGDYDVGATRS